MTNYSWKLFLLTGRMEPRVKEASSFVLFFFKKRFYLFLERGEGRQKERERNIDRLPRAPLWGLVSNPGMCPDPELKGRPFGLWDNAQPAEPLWSERA